MPTLRQGLIGIRWTSEAASKCAVTEHQVRYVTLLYKVSACVANNDLVWRYCPAAWFWPAAPHVVISDGVLEDMSLASRVLEDTFSSPWPWPRVMSLRVRSLALALWNFQWHIGVLTPQRRKFLWFIHAKTVISVSLFPSWRDVTTLVMRFCHQPHELSNMMSLHRERLPWHTHTLGFMLYVLGLGLGLVAYVLGLGLAICVLDSITGGHFWSDLALHCSGPMSC